MSDLPGRREPSDCAPLNPGQRLEAVFISDLHLHPDEHALTERFHAFVRWAVQRTASVYILGDFFHAWAGDDTLDAWSQDIARALCTLSDAGIAVFYMHGNRDFLLGRQFAALAGMTLLPDPSVVRTGPDHMLLTHGDALCTDDRLHQWFRRLTRNRIFVPLFLRIPKRLRERMVHGVRRVSRGGQQAPWMDVVPRAVRKLFSRWSTRILIHGHTHKPGRHPYTVQNRSCVRFVLSDWDDSPQILCYDISKGLYFIQLSCIPEVSHG